MGYVVFFAGLISFIFILGPLIQAEAGYRINKITGVKRTVPNIVVPSESSVPQAEGSGEQISFSNVIASENNIIPVSTEYGIVIEKINAKIFIFSFVR